MLGHKASTPMFPRGKALPRGPLIPCDDSHLVARHPQVSACVRVTQQGPQGRSLKEGCPCTRSVLEMNKLKKAEINSYPLFFPVLWNLKWFKIMDGNFKMRYGLLEKWCGLMKLNFRDNPNKLSSIKRYWPKMNNRSPKKYAITRLAENE